MSRHIMALPLIFACICIIAQLPSSGAISGGSIKAQLLHREHRSLISKLANSSSTAETTITDGGPGEYFMSISLGTPPQNFVAVADTGSSLVWLQCAPCEQCFNQSDPVFNPSLSSTYAALPCSSTGCIAFNKTQSSDLTSCDPNCQYQYAYGDTSNTTGNFSSETLNLMSTAGDNLPVTVPDFWFGCSHSSYSSMSSLLDSDGLVGLGQGPISLPAQLASYHGFEDKFSFCLVNRSLAAVQSSLLIFGHDAEIDNIAGPLQYTPILPGPTDYRSSFYYVGLEGITVGGIAVNFSSSALAIDDQGNGGTIFDTGTSVTHLADVALTPLVSAIAEQIHTSPDTLQMLSANESAQFGFNLCYDIILSTLTTDAFPTISFKFANSTSWDLPFGNSWISAGEQNNQLIVCLAILSSNFGVSIVGNVQMHDFYVVIDRDNQKIGFAATDCGAVGQQ